ncbi:hypothetical protein BC829DRAFT_400942, partial [Chytridium lagenaria]
RNNETLQENLKADTIQMRIENELYLRSHPEIKTFRLCCAASSAGEACRR